MSVPKTEVSDLVVCVLPNGFEMTEERWSRIMEEWNAKGRRLLQAEEVADLFRLSHCTR